MERSFLLNKQNYFVVLVTVVEVVDIDIGEVAESLFIDDESLIMVEAESVAAIDETESLDMVAVFSVVLFVEQAVASAIIDRAKKADLVIAFIVWDCLKACILSLNTFIG